MNRWIVFVITLGCVVYAEPGSGRFLQALVLPAIALAGTLYLLGWLPSLLLGAAGLCFYHTDLYSDSLLDSVALPLFGLGWLLVLLYWAWKSGHLQGGGGHGGEGSGGGFDGGCDGGGCGGGE